MKVSQVYKKKRSLSFEIFPPKKDAELDNIDETLEVLAELDPDFTSSALHSVPADLPTATVR